jgi:hypothetical protein
MNFIENIIYNYALVIDEYFQHMIQSEILKSIENSTYILCIGLNTIIHIYKIVLINTNNIENAYKYCQKAYYCFLEYIEQMNKTNLLHNLNNSDAIIFVYKKTIGNAVSISIKNTDETSSEEKEEQRARADSFSMTSPFYMDILNKNIVIKNVNLYHIIENISIITKTLLFFTDTLFYESGEHKIIKNITIHEIYDIANKHLKRFLLLSLNETKEDIIEIYTYVQYIQEKIKMNSNEYDNFLKELYKSIKINIKQNKKIDDLKYKYLELCIEENISIIQTLLNNKKYNEIVHRLLD